MKEIRTRFAPSPTGFMHIGNLRSTIFEYLIAKHDNGKFILRIEDTDQSRKVEGAIEFIYNTCKLCGIEFDEGPNNPGEYGPYIQSERLDIYKKYALQLVEKGAAYYCFCTEERLEELRKDASLRKVAFQYDGHCKNLTKEEIEERLKKNEKYVIRQRMPKEGESTYHDLVYGDITVENKILEDQILLKSDGYPTYNFANVIDDHLMGINYVARGNEYLMSTPKYNLLYDAFGWEKPTYVHLPLVLGGDGQKLSKRNGDASFMDLYNDGYLPEAVVNYLALLGWSSKDNKEIFTLEELCQEFDPTRISKAPAIYDVKKLQWINTHYIKKLSNEELLSLTLPHLEKAYNLENKCKEWLTNLVTLYQDELKYGAEIVELVKLFFDEEFTMNEETKEFLNQDGVNDTIKVFKEELEKIDIWSTDKINECIQSTKEKAGVKGKMLYMPIRIKASGIMHGPDLASTIYLLGKEKVLNNLCK